MAVPQRLVLLVDHHRRAGRYGRRGEGARIPVRDESGNIGFVRHDGQEIWSVMDERLLKEIALETGGAYVPARTRAYDLGQICEKLLAQLTRGEIQAEKRKRYGEQFQIFVCLGLGFFLLEMLIPGYASKKTGSKAKEMT